MAEGVLLLSAISNLNKLFKEKYMKKFNSQIENFFY